MKDKETYAQQFSIIIFTFLMLLTTIIVRSSYILHIFILICFYAVLAQSWDLLFGYTGITSFAHAAFVGIGAYTSALLCINYGINPWLGLIGGGLFAAACSLIIGFSTLRIKIGSFLATTTIAFNEIARIIIQDPLSPITQGVLGLTGIPRFPTIMIGDIEISFGIADKAALLVLATLLFFVISVSMVKIGNSRVGLRLRAIREDDDAASAVGIDTTKYKILAFALSAFIAGVMGGFYAHYFGTIDPNLLRLEQQILIMAIVVAGGRGTLYGGIWVSLVLIPSLEFLRPLGPGRFIVYGIALVLALRFTERGLVKGIKDLMMEIPIITTYGRRFLEVANFAKNRVLRKGDYEN